MLIYSKRAVIRNLKQVKYRNYTYFYRNINFFLLLKLMLNVFFKYNIRNSIKLQYFFATENIFKELILTNSHEILNDIYRFSNINKSYYLISYDIRKLIYYLFFLSNN